MNFKKLVFASLLACSLGVVSVSYAAEEGAPSAPPAEQQQPGHHKHHGMMGKKGEIYGQLNLTDEQKTKLEENKTKNREQMKATFEKVHSYREALSQELMKPELDMTKVNEIQGQIKTLQAQMADNRLNSILEVRKILTPEQFAKFLSLMGKHKEHEGQHAGSPPPEEKE